MIAHWSSCSVPSNNCTVTTTQQDSQDLPWIFVGLWSDCALEILIKYCTAQWLPLEYFKRYSAFTSAWKLRELSPEGYAALSFRNASCATNNTSQDIQLCCRCASCILAWIILPDLGVLKIVLKSILGVWWCVITLACLKKTRLGYENFALHCSCIFKFLSLTLANQFNPNNW